jgi:hypothetical protein
MTIYVYRDGEIVSKTYAKQRNKSPYVSRFTPYESPVTGAPVTSDRQREVDLFKSNSYDVRDVGPNHAIAKAKEARKADNAARQSEPEQRDFWRD